MKKVVKLFFALVMTALLYVAPTFAAKYSPGLYYAKVNINVRSQPQVGENRINHFKKWGAVYVTRYVGADWCKVNYVRGWTYKNAYVYCPNLVRAKGTGTSSSNSAKGLTGKAVTNSSSNPSGSNTNSTNSTNTGASGPVTGYGNGSFTSGPKSGSPSSTSSSALPGIGQAHASSNAPADAVSEVGSWLGSEGIPLINKSYDNALQKAQLWNKGAKVSKFNLNYSQLNQPSCAYYFVGDASARGRMVKINCARKASQMKVTTMKAGDNKPLAESNVRLRDFVGTMEQDAKLKTEINNQFAGGTALNNNYWLKNGADSRAEWSLEMVDTSIAKKMTIKTKADTGTVNLEVNKY